MHLPKSMPSPYESNRLGIVETHSSKGTADVRASGNWIIRVINRATNGAKKETVSAALQHANP